MTGFSIARAITETLSVGAATWAAAALARLLNARRRSDRARSALLRLDGAVLAVVREIQKLTVEALKAEAPGGRLGANVASMVKRAAVSRVERHLGVNGILERGRAAG